MRRFLDWLWRQASAVARMALLEGWGIASLLVLVGLGLLAGLVGAVLTGAF